MTVAIGADHRGYQLKMQITQYLQRRKIQVLDCGTDSNAPVDYPVIALAVAQSIQHHRARFGILLCYTGNGMAIAANKVKGVRAALVWEPVFARFARMHNDANILVLPAGFIADIKKIKRIISIFLKTPFALGRHRRRVSLIRRYENTHA